MTITHKLSHIVSLSRTATEMLFAIGAVDSGVRAIGGIDF